MRSQRQALLAAVTVFSLLILYQFVYLPGRKQVLSLRSAASRKSGDLAKLEAMRRQYQAVKNQAGTQQVVTVSSDFSLLEFIGEVVEKTRLRENIREVKPLPDSRVAGMVQERVSCVIDSVTLEKVCELMQALQDSGTHIYVPTFRLKKNREKPFFLTVEFEALVLKGQPPAR